MNDDTLARALGGARRRIGAAVLGALLAAGCGGSDPVAGRIGTLSTGRPEARRQAAAELGQAAEPAEAPRVVSALAAALEGDDDAEVRAAAARSLGEVVRRVPEADGGEAARTALSKGLEDPDPEVRSAAGVALARIGEASEALYPALLGALRSRSLALRDDADAALSALPVASLAHLEALIEGLDDGEEVVRRASRMALSQAELAVDPDAGADALAAATGPEADAEVRALVAFVLGRLPAASSTARDHLIAALDDPEAEVRSSAATALRPFAAADPLAADALRSATADDEDAEVRLAAAAALADPGRPKDEARAALLAAILADGASDASLAELADALEADAPDSIDRLIAALSSDDPTARAPAARGLGVLAPRTAGAMPAVAALIAALDDPEPEVRVSAADALSRFGQAARDAIPALTALLEGDDPRAASHAAAALLLVDPPPTR